MPYQQKRRELTSESTITNGFRFTYLSQELAFKCLACSGNWWRDIPVSISELLQSDQYNNYRHKNSRFDRRVGGSQELGSPRQTRDHQISDGTHWKCSAIPPTNDQAAGDAASLCATSQLALYGRLRDFMLLCDEGALHGQRHSSVLFDESISRHQSI